MKDKTILGIALIIILVAIIAFSALFSTTKAPGLEIVDIKVKDPEPSLLDSRYVTIDLGESVTLDVKVQNKGDNITQRDTYTVGIDVIYPDKGADYWLLPSEELIRTDLGPGGKSRHTFRLENRKEVPFSGKFRIQGYIKPIKTGKEIARSDKVTIEIKYPV